MFFHGWNGLLRVLVTGALAYVGLVALLRLSGKRTLSKMNAFDFVVTVALGSSLATVLLSKDVALAEGILAFAVLIGLQYAATFGSVRSPSVRRALKASPALLFYRGEFLDLHLRRERVTEGEIRAAVREQGYQSLAEVEAVVLETAGDLSVVASARRRGERVPATSPLLIGEMLQPETPPLRR